MQFFIVHPDPKTNASILPDYAIKRVNVREGWQIICDIGHNLGISWEGQNKPYSIWHAETRRFMVNREAFQYFYRHYCACLDMYIQRFGKRTVFHTKFDNFFDFAGGPLSQVLHAIPKERTHEEFMLDYMLRAKNQHMTEEEVRSLTNVKGK
jgi:hypothetical protein